VIGNEGLRTKLLREFLSGSGGGSDECFLAATTGRHSLLSFPDRVLQTSSKESGKQVDDRFSSSEVSMKTIESIMTPCPFRLLSTLKLTDASLVLGEVVLPIGPLNMRY